MPNNYSAKDYIPLFIKIAELSSVNKYISKNILPPFSRSDFEEIDGWFSKTFNENPYGTTAQALNDFYTLIKGNITPKNSQAHLALSAYYLCNTKVKKEFEIIRSKSNNLITEDIYTQNLRGIKRTTDKRLYRLHKNLFKEFLDITTEETFLQKTQVPATKQRSYFYKIDIAKISLLTNAEDFYNGRPPTIEDIASDYDFIRYLYKEENELGIKYSIKKLMKEEFTGLRFILVHGTSGSGRTTILKRLAFDFTKENYNVYYLEEREDYTSIKKEDITSEVLQLITDKNCLVIIDDLFLNGALDLRYLLSKSCPSNSIIIFSEHSSVLSRINPAIKRIFSGENILKKFPCDELDQNEIEEFATKITKLENEGEISKRNFNLSVEEKIELCKNLADSRLFIAMMQLRYGEPFNQIVKNECETIITDRTLKEIYKTICFFNSVDLGIPELLIDRAYESLEYQGVSSLIGNILIHDKSGQFLYARHSLIAQEVFSIYREERNENYKRLYKLFSNIDLRRFIKNEIALYENFFWSDKSNQIISVLLGNNEDPVIQLYNELSHELRLKNTDFYFRLILMMAIGSILKNKLRAHDKAETAIYSKLDRIKIQDYANKEREKQIIISLMMDRINNQFESGNNIESAIIMGENLMEIVGKYLIPERRAYFFYQYARILRYSEIRKYFLKADDYFKMFREIKKGLFSGKQKREIKRYEKQKDEVLKNEDEISHEYILKDDEYILLKNKLVHKIIKMKSEVEPLDILNRHAMILWVEENLEEKHKVNFYNNLARCIYRFKIHGSNMDISNHEIDKYFQIAIQYDNDKINESVRIYYGEFLKDINGQEQNALKYIDQVLNSYINYQGVKNRTKLYNEGHASFVKASIIYKYQNNFKNTLSLADADTLAFKALNNFDILIKEHIMNIEIREKDYYEKHNSIKELIVKIAKAIISKNN